MQGQKAAIFYYTNTPFVADVNVYFSDVECSKRWQYIRDYYIRKKGKPGTGSPGEAAKKRTTLLSFLDSYNFSKGKLVLPFLNCNRWTI